MEPVLVPSTIFVIADTTADRPRHSIRRTSHLDTVFQADGGLRISGGARDLRTAPDGTATIVGEASVDAGLDGDHQLRSLTCEPSRDISPLLRAAVAQGFRKRLEELAVDPVERAHPRFLLLDELPVMALISGYASLYKQDMAGSDAPDASPKRDICSGWVTGGTMMGAYDTVGEIPIPVGPPAPLLERDDDPLAWHRIDALGADSMRRRRLVEMTSVDGPTWPFSAFFRDTYRPADGIEIVLHEYAIFGTLDTESMRILTSEAFPHVLPWVECPGAAASAGWVEGVMIGQIRDVVRRQFRGTSTCTHLNDLIRSLGDLGPLVAAVDPA